jgi:hypothetical protein
MRHERKKSCLHSEASGARCGRTGGATDPGQWPPPFTAPSQGVGTTTSVTYMQTSIQGMTFRRA